MPTPREAAPAGPRAWGRTHPASLRRPALRGGPGSAALPLRRRRGDRDRPGPAAAMEMEVEVAEDEKAGPAAGEKRGPSDPPGAAPAASGHYELPW